MYRDNGECGGMKTIDDERWKCPICETFNYGDNCIVCGEKKKIVRFENTEKDNCALKETYVNKHISETNKNKFFRLRIILMLIGIPSVIILMACLVILIMECIAMFN